MDSTTTTLTPIPTSFPIPSPSPTQAIKAAASKLPIKRKAPDPNPSSPNSVPDPILTPDPNYLPPVPNFPTHLKDSSFTDSRPPPFKFHRIWTEPDEIRFLRGLLNAGSHNLSFPRDLDIFFSRFSNTMSQPYSKSQLSEKLRRLRKKFWVVSTRICKGLDECFLSSHDRALYEISMQLWHPDYAGTSPFLGSSNDKAKKSDLVGVEVSFLPDLTSGPDFLVDNFELNCENNDNLEDDNGFLNVGFDGDAKLSEVNVEFDDEEEMGWQNGEEIEVEETVAAKAVIDVFDETLEELRLGVLNEGLSFNDSENEVGKRLDFDRLWRKQKVAEFDVLARRMRLVFEQSLIPRQ